MSGSETKLDPLQALTVLLEAIHDAAKDSGKSGASGKAPADPSMGAASGAPPKERGASMSRATKRVARKAAKKGKKLFDAGKGFKDAVDRIRKQEYDKRKALINADAVATLSTMNSNMAVIAGRYRGLGKAVKAGLIAEATMKSANAANDAYSRAMALPKPFGLAAAPVAAAAALGIGAAKVAEISAKKFEDGGPVESEQTAELEGGEFVVSREMVRELGGFDRVAGALGEASNSGVDVVPVINIRIDGDADSGAVTGAREQVRQGLAAFAMGMG